MDQHKIVRALPRERPRLQPGLPQPLLEVWRTRDGREIRISTMKDGHLLNTINYLRRQAPEKKVEFEHATLDHHPELQGEAAIAALEAEARLMDDMAYELHLVAAHPQYLRLVEEAQRRDLPLAPFDEAAAQQEGRVLAMRYLLQKRGF